MKSPFINLLRRCCDLVEASEASTIKLHRILDSIDNGNWHYFHHTGYNGERTRVGLGTDVIQKEDNPWLESWRQSKVAQVL